MKLNQIFGSKKTIRKKNKLVSSNSYCDEGKVNLKREKVTIIKNSGKITIIVYLTVNIVHSEMTKLFLLEL